MSTISPENLPNQSQNDYYHWKTIDNSSINFDSRSISFTRKQESQDSENPDYLTKQLITYIGSKRALLGSIGRAINLVRQELHQDKLIFLDLFSGSGIVARLAKQYSKRIIVNDLEDYSRIINDCYLSNHTDRELATLRPKFAPLCDEINRHAKAGFISEYYAPKCDEQIAMGERVFYTRRNAIYLDTARQVIAALPQKQQKFLLAPLLSAASVHVNTSGIFKGFHKNRSGIGQFGGTGKNALSRILHPISLQLPILSNFSSQFVSFTADATELVRELPLVDLAYFDPPYNQHPYGSNYFMLNLLCHYQPPPCVSAVSGIPVDWNRSDYNRRAKAATTLFATIATCRAKFILVSYNSEGYIGFDQFQQELSRLGRLYYMDSKYNCFRGSRNLRNRPTHLKEFLFLLDMRPRR